MLVAMTSTGPYLDAKPVRTFGRCPCILFVDTETGACSGIRNPGTEAVEGAGVLLALLLVDRGVRAVITGRVGPHAMDVLTAAGIRILDLGDNNARTAIARMKKGELAEITAASAPRRGFHGKGGRGGGGGERNGVRGGSP